MEPHWLQEKRKKAAGKFEQLPLPVTDEFWRPLRLDRLHVDHYLPLPPAQNGAAEGSAARQMPVQVVHSGELFYGEKISTPTLDEKHRKAGVKLLSLSAAIQESPEIVKKYLGSGFQNRADKFLLQNEAQWQSGAFCYIPKNVSVESPLLLASHFAAPAKGISPRLLVVLDKGARATLVHHAASETGGGANFTNPVFEIYLEEDASLDFIDLQNLSGETIEIGIKRAEVGTNAKFLWIIDQRGSKISKIDIETVLKGTGAVASVYGLLLGREQQQLELFSLTQHIARHTTANILVKATAQDRAKTIFQGLIRFEKSAQQTESYMANHNLVLSDKAHADSIPRLEIEADDVKASHGASIGQVDKEQLFYLCSKGLTREIAERLLIEGFYEEIFGKVPLEPIREMMRSFHEVQR